MLIQNVDTNTMHHITGLKTAVKKSFYVHVNHFGIMQ